ncbi:MAG: hypothetical protein WB608_15345 [Terracidiphilus sp.]
MKRSDGAKRGRRAMALTNSGESFLSEEWKNSLDPRREMESILRSAIAALLMGDIGEAIKFLFRSASEREKHQGPQELRSASLAFTPIDLHAEVRAVYEHRRRGVEAEVLRRFAEKLEALAGASASLESAHKDKH